MHASPGPQIAIIGAGFSGTAVAIQLLRRARSPMRLIMINRSGQLARGLAYGTHSPHHILNVPAGRMSLFPSEPNDFLDYLLQRDATWRASDFVPRNLYGDYLAHRLKEAIAQSKHIVFEQCSDDVGEIKPCANGRLDLHFKTGTSITVDRAVLAVGNYAPATPAPFAGLTEDVRYIADPWAVGKLARIDPTQPVLLLGTGLTMCDVALELSNLGIQAPMIALSRRGLVPQAHREAHQPPEAARTPPGMETAESIREYLRLFRAWQQQQAQLGVDWRDMMAALRAQTPALWQRLSQSDRAQFLRHLQPYWDTHRHRCAPGIGQAISTLRESLQLVTRAGRIIQAEATNEHIDITVRWRGQQSLNRFQVGTVINCTGPAAHIPSIQDTLLRSLLARGDAQADPLGLGLLTTSDYRLQGHAMRTLYHIGPLLKAQHWESTAVPELREHAAHLASALLTDIATRTTPDLLFTH